MADRYWILHGDMGYVGTSSQERIDLCDHWGYSPEEIDEMDQEDVKNDLDEEAWENACEKVNAYAVPNENQDGD